MAGDFASDTDSLAAALQDRYHIERVLARGGMATVYVAEDVRHHRRVAIKVLRAELAAEMGSERFLREIRTTATLQHAHILGLIDSGEAGDLLYYVMPLVEGETLRARLTREQQLPVSDALRIAQEVAAALDYAHRHGVVHRDIKPENILMQDGSALVADFGIAVAVTSARVERLTSTGLSVGTPEYMSPEQAAGERVIDARTDIFALGALTYEMLIGEPPFSGATVQQTIARVMSESPRSLVAQRRSIPPHVETAVLRALEKLPADRFNSAREFAAALSAPGVLASVWPLPRAGHRVSIVAGALAASALALAVGWALGRRGHEARVTSDTPSRLAIVAPQIGGTGLVGLQRQLALTPDGTTLLYVAVTPDGNNQLVRQSLDALEPTPIANIRSGTTPSLISTDGRWFVGWVAGDREAYRYPIAGGPGEPLQFTGGYTDWAQWDEQGTIWFSPRDGGGLWRLDRGDSVAHAAGRGAEGLRLQQLLPDARHALVLIHNAQSSAAAILDVETGERSPLLPMAVVDVRYVAGYLVYVLPNGTLQAAPFDVERRRITGVAIPIGTSVSLTGSGGAQLTVAQNGTVAYIVEEPPSLVFVNRAGASRMALDGRRNYHGPRFSPDGQRVAVDFNSRDGRDVWIVTVEDGTLSRATFDRDGHDGVWFPDGRFITYTSTRSGTQGIYRQRPGGAERAESLFASPQLGFTGVWLRDGSEIVTAVNDLHPGSAADIAIVRNGGRGPLEALVATEYTEAFPALSPDSRWIAYTSDQSGRSEVYVRAVHGASDAVQITRDGGTEAVWGPNGHELFYRTVGDSEPRLAVANVHTTPSFAVERRQSLFSLADIVSANPHSNYDISPDGATFVMVRRSPATRIMVIQNLSALVRHLQAK